MIIAVNNFDPWWLTNWWLEYMVNIKINNVDDTLFIR